MIDCSLKKPRELESLPKLTNAVLYVFCYIEAAVARV
jgi:hypothetical protein